MNLTDICIYYHNRLALDKNRSNKLNEDFIAEIQSILNKSNLIKTNDDQNLSNEKVAS